jgi:hypothetical protein
MSDTKPDAPESGAFTALEVGSEGGAFVVYSRLWEPLLDAADGADGFVTWDAAVKRLDRYPWATLSVRFVHPAVEEFVLQAVLARTNDPRMRRRWTDAAARSRQVSDAQTAAVGVRPSATLRPEQLRFRVVLNSMGYPDED